MARFRLHPSTVSMLSSLAVGVAPRPTPGAAATDTQTKDVVPDRNTVLITIALVIAGALVGESLQHPAFTPASGISVFAVMYIVAQVIERLQEPFVPWVGRSGTVDKPTAKATRDEKVAKAIENPGDPAKAIEAAKAQRVVDQIRANLTLLLWGSSAALAMVASGYFGLYLLKGVGVNGSSLWLDIIVTGLAIGGGTKPLHDLIGNISASKKAKEDPAETA